MNQRLPVRRMLTAGAVGLITASLCASPVAARDDGAIEPQIVGGQPAPVGAYPFIAALLNENAGGTDYDKQFCGGALIAPQWVLTASHCVEGASPNDLAVAVGRTVLSSDQGERRDVIEIHMHPQFDEPVGLAHDAALLRLAAPVSQASIRVAGSGDDSFEAAGTSLRVIGWGNTKGSGGANFPDQLMQVDVPAVSDTTCGRAYGASLDKPTMLCAGVQGKDSCQGDSGGPLFATASNGTRVHMGIVSWGNGCGKRRFPGVYGESNNPDIRSWIQSVAGV